MCEPGCFLENLRSDIIVLGKLPSFADECSTVSNVIIEVF